MEETFKQTIEEQAKKAYIEINKKRKEIRRIGKEVTVLKNERKAILMLLKGSSPKKQKKKEKKSEDKPIGI